MYGKDKFYLLIDDIKSEFSFYGCDTTWSGKVVDQNDNVVNDSFTIHTCEAGVDLHEAVYLNWLEVEEECTENKMFDEEGEIVDQKAYDEAVKGMIDVYMEYYWEMDADVSEYKEIDGHNCKKISVEYFIARHQIGEVGSFVRLRNSHDCNSVEGLMALEHECGWHLDFGEWSDDFVYLDEFEWDDNYSDYIEGWLSTTNGGQDYITYYGLKDEESRRMLEELLNAEKTDEYYTTLKNMIYDACDNHESISDFQQKHSISVN